MKTSRTLAAKLSVNRCPERGCVVLDQPQHVVKFWCSGFFHALQLVFDSAALLFAAVATVSLLLLCPPSAHAHGGVPLWTNRYHGPGGGGAIAVASSGDVVVTGTSYGIVPDRDYATVKYSSTLNSKFSAKTRCNSWTCWPWPMAASDNSGPTVTAGRRTLLITLMQSRWTAAATCS